MTHVLVAKATSATADNASSNQDEMHECAS